MLNNTEVRSDVVNHSGVKLKDYINSSINDLADDLIVIAKSDKQSYSKDEVFEMIQKCRNNLLCIKEICKTRNKF